MHHVFVLFCFKLLFLGGGGTLLSQGPASARLFYIYRDCTVCIIIVEDNGYAVSATEKNLLCILQGFLQVSFVEGGGGVRRYCNFLKRCESGAGK